MKTMRKTQKLKKLKKNSPIEAKKNKEAIRKSFSEQQWRKTEKNQRLKMKIEAEATVTENG
jgi:hypothetical protein